MKAQDQKEIHASEVPLWRNRGFLLLWGSQAISSIGSGISEIAFPLLVLAFTHSPLDAGLVGALRVLPSLLFSLPGGVLVDRWSRKKVMLFCYIGRGANIATIPLALLFLRLTLAQLCIVAFIDGTLSIFFGLSSIAALPHVVPEGQLPDAVAQNEVGESVTVMVSPMLGGYLFGVLNALPFLFDLISYVLATAFLLFMHMDFQPTGRQQHTSFRK
ncbi:MAG TPA: MFS transporter, partial [Ktedonobacteraceae bacterium]|nr:MFS transporter [Ktedonobacteraceae bacterium]